MHSNIILKTLLRVFCDFDINQIDSLPYDIIYSHDYPHEFKERLEYLFTLLKKEGISKLVAEPSKCKFCYPNGEAYRFYNSENGEFIFKYVFDVKEKGFITVEECKNNPIPDGPNGEPF